MKAYRQQIILTILLWLLGPAVAFALDCDTARKILAEHGDEAPSDGPKERP